MITTLDLTHLPFSADCETVYTCGSLCNTPGLQTISFTAAMWGEHDRDEMEDAAEAELTYAVINDVFDCCD